MTKSIDFYFDIISPYAYLAYKQLNSLENLKQIKFNYKPILLGGLHKLAGITAPAFNEFKMKNMKNDCNLISSKKNIKFQWNDKFPINSLKIMRGYLSVNEEKKDIYLETFFNAYWQDNIDLENIEVIKNLLKKIDVDTNKFFNDLEDIKIKEKLKEITNSAFEKEVFGAPTFIVNDKLFWGQDRLDYALEEYSTF
jgi:2-hydroxychromene-2-carboxylate isomerase